MTKLLILFSFILSLGAYAQPPISNEDCIRVYRDNAIDLKVATDDFNDGYMDKIDYGAKVGQISTIVSAQRLACIKLEDPEAKTCVKEYKKIYKSLRNKISIPAVLFGNQTEVEVGIKFQAKLKYRDFRCGFSPSIF